MTLHSSMFPPRDPSLQAEKKKRVLLVDTSRVKRGLRSETMRKLGIEVDCAADISEARCWWRAALYDLVLIHVEDAPGPVTRFCNDLRAATPPQQIMFLVGGPTYLASAPNEPASDGGKDAPPSQSNEMAATASNGANGEPQPWGIMEACRRISAIRSVCDARSKAVRNRPEPQRVSETSRSGHMLDTSTMELLREESQ